MYTQRDSINSSVNKSARRVNRLCSVPHSRRGSVADGDVQLPRIENRGSIGSELRMSMTNEYEDKLKKEFNNLLHQRAPSISERHHDFIYERRAKEGFIYTGKKKMMHQPVPVTRGTSSMVVTQSSRTEKELRLDTRIKIPKRSKFLMKWNVFQWTIEHKKEVINALWKNYGVFIQHIKKKNKTLTKADFMDIMAKIGLGHEKEITDKIFWALDNDNSGDIDYRELISGLEFFRDSSFEDKIKVLIDVCGSEGSGKLAAGDLYNILKVNIVGSTEMSRLKKIIATIFNIADTNRDGCIDKNELINVAHASKELKELLDESLKMIRKVDKHINNNFQEKFQAWLPGGFVINAKEGFHHPSSHLLVNMLKETEIAWYKTKVLKDKLREQSMKIKNASGAEISNDIEDFESV